MNVIVKECAQLFTLSAMAKSSYLASNCFNARVLKKKSDVEKRRLPTLHLMAAKWKVSIDATHSGQALEPFSL